MLQWLRATQDLFCSLPKAVCCSVPWLHQAHVTWCIGNSRSATTRLSKSLRQSLRNDSLNHRCLIPQWSSGEFRSLEISGHISSKMKNSLLQLAIFTTKNETQHVAHPFVFYKKNVTVLGVLLWFIYMIDQNPTSIERKIEKRMYFNCMLIALSSGPYNLKYSLLLKVPMAYVGVIY